MLNGKDILVVDDEVTHRLLTRECLEEFGYHVREATNGAEALASARLEMPDLILLDLKMPGQDGISVLKEIRADKSIAGVPVIIVTGADEASAVERAFDEKANDFVTKPVFWPLLPHRLEFVFRNEEREATLLTALHEAQKAEFAKAGFLAAMSHELRTPLNAIIGFSELIINDKGHKIDREKCSEYATHVHTGGKHLLNVVSDILDTVKLEEGKFVLHVEEINLRDFLTDCHGLLERTCEQEAHAFILDGNADLPLISADPQRLRQIILNLVSNAAKFTPAGGRIELSARKRADGFVEIIVADDGIGMSPQEVEMAVQPFQQVDSSLARKHEGSGLGLPIAKALTELHAGTLQIESTPGRGTKVIVCFPEIRAASDNAKRAAGMHAETG